MKHELRRIYLHIWSELQLRGLQVAALCALSALGTRANEMSKRGRAQDRMQIGFAVRRNPLEGQPNLNVTRVLDPGRSHNAFGSHWECEAGRQRRVRSVLCIGLACLPEIQ
ncbi:hypothetical protein OH76DRAFT_877345 [Lentinus brumalis]|uniref:Uncharacterized protein n=1 Tax=Lentinus brumalis TaxID=2498619 RepID=A0A371DRW8_9APHY|nr:hypothetical protein OH76DRAFT_877345 [Polyporus brumalis]